MIIEVKNGQSVFIVENPSTNKIEVKVAFKEEIFEPMYAEYIVGNVSNRMLNPLLENHCTLHDMINYRKVDAVTINDSTVIHGFIENDIRYILIHDDFKLYDYEKRFCTDIEDISSLIPDIDNYDDDFVVVLNNNGIVYIIATKEEHNNNEIRVFYGNCKECMEFVEEHSNPTKIFEYLRTNFS